MSYTALAKQCLKRLAFPTRCLRLVSNLDHLRIHNGNGTTTVTTVNPARTANIHQLAAHWVTTGAFFRFWPFDTHTRLPIEITLPPRTWI